MSDVGRAVSLLQAGELVVIPTETVYGLAADALNPEAVRRIFIAKGRPTNHPLIVHVAGPGAAEALAETGDPRFAALARAFWPGPLAMVLPKKPSVPDEVTGGHPTVALRCPDHPLSLRLLESGLCLAAPSANRFTRLSPTQVADLDPELLAFVGLVLDGGPCRVGIESTVLDLSGGPARVLRPGFVSREMIEAALGEVVEEGPSATPSPGQHPVHYAPRTPLILVPELGDRPGIGFGKPGAGQIPLPRDPAGYAQGLYHALHELDSLGLSEIAIESPPTDEAWKAVWDRLRRASG